MSGSPSQEAKLGVVERWISSQAGYTCPTPTSTSPKASNPSSPNAGLYRTGTPPFGQSQTHISHDSIASLSFNAGSGNGFNSTMATKSNVVSQYSGNVSSPPLTGFAGGKMERLYEAFNELHGLAQDFQKPFDAPAILVVGHQTDGKSALIEALMGFQFNHVGGGTKTRRPITLHMTYNASCEEPICYLVSEDNQPMEEDKSLEDIQAYIEAENMRLEQEACQFSAKEIILKIEYKYCPNLTIIDTPGLIAAAPGRKNRVLQSIRKSECPKELEPADRRNAVHVNLIKRDEDCPVREQPYIPFQGVGRTLGSSSSSVPEPSVPSNLNPVGNQPSQGLTVDDSKPSTSVQLRLADGTRMVAHFNHHHTIADIRAFIDAARPGGATTYQLQAMGFPPKPLNDLMQTIEEAGLTNSVIIQKF